MSLLAPLRSRSPRPRMTSAAPAPLPTDDTAPVLKAVADITGIDAAAWDRCAGDANPFVSHAFLAALERSGSTAAETGWLPQHLVLESPGGRVLGCVPAYLKSHSYGEYVFDHGWAHAFERAGGDYYPKLQVSVPFTPVTGPRLLIAPGEDRAEVGRILAAGLRALCERHGASSIHVTFPEQDQWDLLGQEGWLRRTGHQYHWFNDGYGSFDDFLTALSSRKRKTIRKERHKARQSGADITVLTGDALREEHWDAFFRFYMDTGSRKWGTPYLTRSFFSYLGETLADRVALVMARDGDRWVAGALNLIGRDALYGRNWGCEGYYKFLHFEACYYQAIDFAIARGLARVEAGAQGEHKLQRGYRPARTYSAHWIRHPGLRAAVADYLDRETDAVDYEIEALTTHASPFRKG